MLEVALLLVAAQAHAAGYDFEKPEFWQKSYQIPDAYCSTRFICLPNSVNMVLPPQCQNENPYDQSLAAYSRCRFPDDAAKDQFVDSVRAVLHVCHETFDCRNPSEFPELIYKRDELSREMKLIEKSSAAIPGIWGLLDAQLGTLNHLIAAQERAKRPIVEVITINSTMTAAVVAGLSSSIGLRENQFRKEDPVQPHWTYHWARVPYQACEQVPLVFLSYAAEAGSRKEKSIRAALGRLGKPYFEPGCRFSDHMMIVTDLSPAEFSRKALSIDGFFSYRRSVMMRYAEDITDDQRFDILNGELATNAEMLVQVGHIRAFVSGELERIRATANQLRELKKKRLVVVKISPPGKLSL